MSLIEEKLIDFVSEALDYFEWDELKDQELDISTEDDSGFTFCDILRAEDDAVFRFFVVHGPVDLNTLLPECFERYRDLEGEYSETDDAILLWKGTEDDEDEDFWYMQRTEEGEIGLFHSDLSLDEDDEDDDEN